jgi:hypothetical protein
MLTYCANSVSTYVCRWSFLLERCRNRKVLDLGFVGDTDQPTAERVHAYQAGLVLYPHLVQAASQIVGVDLNAETVHAIQKETGAADLLVGDVESLENAGITGTFDVIVFGDLIEHLSRPGLALDGIRKFMSEDTELIISTPNAFSLLANIRFSVNKFREGNEHVASYSKFTLPTLLARHGLKLTELYTCYDRPPRSLRQRFLFWLGKPLFRLLPERGGTLLAVAKVASFANP